MALSWFDRAAVIQTGVVVVITRGSVTGGTGCGSGAGALVVAQEVERAGVNALGHGEPDYWTVS